MKKRVLGLDIGIASLGWAVVDIDEELMTTKNKNESKYKINSGEIAGSGVRVWKEPVDRQGRVWQPSEEKVIGLEVLLNEKQNVLDIS